jgi:glutamate/aspartate transport system permease protein
VLSLPDLLGTASRVAQRDFRIVEMYIFAAVIYFTISFIASRVVHLLRKRISIVR